MSAHHGNTPAGWTGAVLATLGFLVGGIGLMLTPVSMVLFWVGAALAVAALPVAAIMAKMGLNS
ncbi:HGxxPAAW family protein [Nocardioides sp.]|uniref:HGxxPAAW family protein n=1 Tax=Nocardioides sp. TaxID=35761 RepID=UPI0035295996